jgi:hypothetical protein
MKRAGIFVLALGLSLVAGAANRGAAQAAPPSPTSPPSAPPSQSSTQAASGETRLDFSGTWSLDPGLSNDPSQASFDARNNDTRAAGGRSGGYGGGRRGGFGGFGPGGGGQRQATASNTVEQRRLQELTDALKNASKTLVISHHDPSFVINDAKDHTEFFQTNGSTDEHHLTSGTVNSATHWQGSRLVTEYEIGSRDKLVYTYTVLPKTKQMVLRVRRESSGGSRTSGPELKLVYNLAGQ